MSATCWSCRVQHDGPAASALQPGDKILQPKETPNGPEDHRRIRANGHSFLHMEHETAVSLLKSFQPMVDLDLIDLWTDAKGTLTPTGLLQNRSDSVKSPE
ncbi:Leucine-rich repeat-containing protein 7 [Liparis tanakae]|uniref:Leucine-rich repeat-containing protein 7 n=1 Tax=Liparis tanakae TaxID=230148 RepID=A0A4Z2FA50_9TELE|nr:Leucine-rich repeat-containing protein 7 [Liparis tanakae]